MLLLQTHLDTRKTKSATTVILWTRSWDTWLAKASHHVFKTVPSKVTVHHVHCLITTPITYPLPTSPSQPGYDLLLPEWLLYLCNHGYHHLLHLRSGLSLLPSICVFCPNDISCTWRFEVILMFLTTLNLIHEFYSLVQTIAPLPGVMGCRVCVCVCVCTCTRARAHVRACMCVCVSSAQPHYPMQAILMW